MISVFLGLLMRKFDKVNARLSVSPKYCRAVTENAIKLAINAIKCLGLKMS